MKVQAIKAGFYAGRRFREGAIFSLLEGAKLGKWMVPVKDAPAKRDVKVEAPSEDSPNTLSEVGKQNAERDAKAQGDAPEGGKPGNKGTGKGGKPGNKGTDDLV